ncbi:MAG: DUF805 domain-containing protein [Hahellaceae bacterium]|nr:DUF805 domain-containing protein [Hahellaceae bacterium]MCP5209684.1 DUF805 domain-containing protein [Hahellaceae bacterium]
MEYFTDALKKYAEFTGRATRQQYWMYILFYFIIYIACVVVDSVIGTFIFSTICSLGLLIPSISIATRRLHDTGRSGWWQLIALIPLIGAIVLLVFLVQSSHPDNEYGPAVN